MFYSNKLLNKRIQIFTSIFLVSLILISTFTMGNLDLEKYNQNKANNDYSQETIPNRVNSESQESTDSTNYNSFSIEKLFDYVKQLYDEDHKIFREIPDGYASSVATYEALAILRFLGLDYYLFGSNWQKSENSLANKLTIDLRDEEGSGGFQLFDEIEVTSLEGTFGVVNSLWIMNEVPKPEIPEIAKLKQEAIDLLDFVANYTFNREKKEFHELGLQSSLKATFEALNILDLVYKVAIMPPQDEKITPTVNQTLLEFMTNYSLGIFNFITSFWTDNDNFYTQNQYRSPIEDTWYALNSIKILERFGSIIGQNFPNKTTDYEDPVKNWLKTTIVTSGQTRGGMSSTNVATVKETGIGYLIFNIFNAIDELNHTETLKFIYSSQFLEKENQTYISSETLNFGGFGPNNLTFSEREKNKIVNIHNTYYAVLTLFLTGDIFNSIELSIETSHYKKYININRSNLIIQGDSAEIDLLFKVYNYKSHGSLEFNTNVDTWNITLGEYTETDETFIGKSQAIYGITLENDSKGVFNWNLGLHKIENEISIRDLPIIQSPTYYLNSTLFVGYANEVNFNTTDFKPGINVTTTIFYQNRSILSYSPTNITLGSVSANITSPDGMNEELFKYKLIDSDTQSINFLLNFSRMALLGTWRLSLIFNQSDFNLTSIIPIEVFDTVELYKISKMPEYYPGESMNLNISLKYTNGLFTPKANATLIFISNETQFETFNMTLKHLEENKYWTNNEICPIRFLYGYYNVSVQLTWNVSSGYQIDKIQNRSLDLIRIKGNPIMIPLSFKTNYRNLTLLSDNLLYYGEAINLSYTVGFESLSKINNLTNATIITKAGLVNNTQPDSYIQLFKSVQRNESIFINGLINPNLPNTTYGTRFQIKSEWNNSFVYLRAVLNTSINASYNITLDGEFIITDITYANTEVTEDGLYEYALDISSVFSITFRVENTKVENLIIPNLNLYGILDIQNREGTLNKSLPSIISGYDENDTAVYLLSIPASGLKPNEYKISIYTWTAISSNLKIGELDPGFKIIRTANLEPIIELHEALILIAVSITCVLLYLNLRRHS